MIDYCDNGLSMTTNEKLILGELVHVELKNYDPNISTPVKKQNYSGIVRWGIRFPASNADTNALFKYGIEFSANCSL